MAKEKLQLIIQAEDKASKEIKEIQKNLKGLKPTFKKIASVGTVAMGVIGLGIWKAVQQAVDAQEVYNKFDVVFSNVGVAAEKAAKNLVDNWGLAESTAKTLLSGTGDLLVGLGMTEDVARR